MNRREAMAAGLAAVAAGALPGEAVAGTTTTTWTDWSCPPSETKFWQVSIDGEPLLLVPTDGVPIHNGLDELAGEVSPGLAIYVAELLFGKRHVSVTPVADNPGGLAVVRAELREAGVALNVESFGDNTVPIRAMDCLLANLNPNERINARLSLPATRPG
jgi:FtsP/CotA-like multicopper oxidase with cupredoxin domain